MSEAPPQPPASLDPLSQGLGDVLLVAERELAPRLGLAEVELPARFARVEGTLRGGPVEMRSRRFEGEAYGALVLAEILVGGERRSATVIGLPGLGSLRPVLGVDLIATGGALSLVALDLSPLDDGFWEEAAAPVLRDVRALAEGELVPRKHPGIAEDSFSRLAVVMSAPPGAEPVAFDASHRLLRGAARLVEPRVDEARREAARERNLAWRRQELANRREAGALASMFGEELARAYLEEFLFSEG